MKNDEIYMRKTQKPVAKPEKLDRKRAEVRKAIEVLQEEKKLRESLKFY